ncbi:hypothetical protein [Nonomuraea recticatena]|uniref:Uncharacterized protein n=1 Tax=Nonomuraea recticatena TaxID=46178 RepID=A0ABN3SWI6_9ACTN
MNEVEIPLESIQSVRYTQYGDSGPYLPSMVISLNPSMAGHLYAFKSDEWVSRKDVQNTHFARTKLLEDLKRRAMKLRERAGNAGAKCRYPDAFRDQARAEVVEEIAKMLSKGGIDVDAL